MQAVIDGIKRREAGTEERIKRAVKAGGKVLAERLSAKAPVDEGELRDSIKAGPVQYTAGDGFSCEVKPIGKHSKTGEPLAKIGNILEYGRSYGEKDKPGLAWFHPTVKAAEGDVASAMRAEFAKDGGA